ncbi:uncharacterized protein LOC143468904 [Clavelina lepadiformis]|uniref:uncharacterized protein LOC143468904 n=1 Tax=Clavelina lepadiformis TaxID=159417 RepID=UPI00404355DD
MMFSCPDEWGDSTKETDLSEALFGEVKLAHDNLPRKKFSKKDLTDAKDKENHLTRKQWKKKQKNKRRSNNKYRLEQKSSKPQNSSSEDDIVKSKIEPDDINSNICNEKINIASNSKRNRTRKRKSANANDVKDIPTDKAPKCSSLIEENSSELLTSEALPTSVTMLESDLDETRGNVLRNKLTAKLNSSRFRFINEQMYTRTSQDTIQLFKGDAGAFQVYHKGFLAQVEKWPVKPLDLIINWVKARPSNLIVSDFGCGEAFLAQSVRNKVYSFDLVALNSHVTEADISNVPLASESVDVVVFCLSLMGTNLQDYLLEANRILKTKGIVKIAEVASRFLGVKPFINDMKKLGFNLIKQDVSNTHFYMFDFSKVKKISKDVLLDSLRGLQLKPCLYKKR